MSYLDDSRLELRKQINKKFNNRSLVYGVELI